MGAVVIFDAIANRPAATIYNTRFFFVATDDAPTSYALSVSDGTAWDDLTTGGGSGTVTSVGSADGTVVIANPTTTPDLSVLLTNILAASTDAGASLITNLLDPVSPQDAATKAYVDAAVTGLPLWFQFDNGSPLGSVVPAQINAIYVDIDPATPGGVYEALGATDADWIYIGGAIGGGAFGVALTAAFPNWAVNDSTGSAAISAQDPTASGTSGAVIGTFWQILDDGEGNQELHAAQILNPVSVDPATIAGKTVIYMLDNGDGTYTLKANVNGNVASLASG